MVTGLAITTSSASARPGPDIVNAHFDAVPVAGVPATLRIKVKDPLAAINGLQLDFGDGSRLNLSACRPAAIGAVLPDVFKIGRPITFPIEHTYEADGRMTVRIIATSGDCMGGRAAAMVDQTVRVLPAPKKLIPDRGPLARIAAAEACPGMFASPGSLSTPAARKAVLCLLNAVRKYFAKRALKGNRKLNRAAQRHATDMVARDFFAHEAPDGTALEDRLRKARFRIRGGIAENIGAGSGPYSSPMAVIISWYWSPPHRTNMLDAGFRLAGIGVTRRMPFDTAPDAGTYDLTLAER
jgi:hypothetical protein